MYLDFMSPDVWNGLVIGVVLIGLALAILRLITDLSRPPRNRPTQRPTYPSEPDTTDLSDRFDPDNE